jgi:uroporphyrinogen decarboxylase
LVTHNILSRDEIRKAIRPARAGGGEKLPCLVSRQVRTPLWYLDFPAETLARHGSRLKRLLRRYPPDFLYSGAAPPMKTLPQPLSSLDEYGVVWKGCKSGVGLHPEVPPIRDWSLLDEYLRRTMPQASLRGRFAEARKVARKRKNEYLLALSPVAFFERMQTLVGIRHFYESVLEHPEKVERLGRAILDFGLDSVDAFARLGYDGFMLLDDLGSQTSLLMSAPLWREMFKPWYKALFERVRSRGMDAMLHSCGNVAEIIDDFIEIGVDVLHPLQPGCMDRTEIAGRYRGRLCFYTGVDVQKLLISGTPEEIREDVRHIKELFQSDDGGGLIIGPTNAITPETPLQNIEAFFSETVAS